MQFMRLLITKMNGEKNRCMKTTISKDSRDQLAKLLDKRIRLTGTIVDIHGHKRRKVVQYQVTLKDVHIDQIPEPIDHLNIFLSKDSMPASVKKLFGKKQYDLLTCTAKVCKYRRRTDESGFRTTAYGVKELKKIELKTTNGELKNALSRTKKS